jgi:hypothetical protein
VAARPRPAASAARPVIIKRRIEANSPYCRRAMVLAA